MCYHKSLVKKEEDLLARYNASFEEVSQDLSAVEQKMLTLMSKDPALRAYTPRDTQSIHACLVAYTAKDALPPCYTRQELNELKWCLKTCATFQNQQISRYHENGFDYLTTPIITAGEPDKFKPFRWGLIPFYMSDHDKAMLLRTQTLNCISEEMYDKPSFRDAAKNAQRCLIPVTGFFEWRWLDEKGTVKIPYHVTFRDQRIRSMAGLYSRWRNKETGDYYHSYTVLTTRANTILDYVHNNKKRMPVFIAESDEKKWLSRDLSQKEVMELCQPSQDTAMRAYTISKHITTRNVITNTPTVLDPMNYERAIGEANQFLHAGDRKKALETFKECIGGEKISISDLQQAASQPIAEELQFND